MRSMLRILAFVAFIMTGSTAMADDHIISIESTRSFDETVAVLTSVLENTGLMTVAIVDHAKSAANVGLELGPVTLFIFGNPKVGSPVMQANPLVALDLPMKMLVAEVDGKVTLTYRSPETLVTAWDLDPVPNSIGKMMAALKSIAEAAAGQ